MYKDEEGYGKLTYSNQELSEEIGLSASTIYRRNKELEDKGILQVIDTDKKDPETGVPIQLKLFDLSKIAQDVLFIKKKLEEKVSYIQEYSGGTTKSERLISDLESFLREFENPKLKELIFDNFQNRIDDIYVGVREHRNLDVLREEFCHLQQDILTKQSEFNNNTVIEVLRKAGFEITKTTKDIITCAIDNYLDINVKTIDNLD